jgi:hypothetical protein
VVFAGAQTDARDDAVSVTQKAFQVLRQAKRQVMRRARALRGPGPEGLWIDRDDAPRQLALRTQDAFLAEHTGNLMRVGVTRIPGVVSHETCDAAIQAFRRHCEASAKEAADYRDGFGYHSRLCNFHLVSPEALDIGLNPRVLELLDFLFDRPAAICSSLTFEKGSQQKLHRDSPFFHTNPEGRFFGVWTALEDVSPDAGPLVYRPGGHRLRVDRLAIAQANPGVPPGDLFHPYVQRVSEACDRQGLPEVRMDTMRKGDVLIWHPQLPHGGSPIADPRRTRQSIVFHYMPEGASIHGVDAFFSERFPDAPNPMRTERGRRMFDHGAPRFDHNN